jgi:hypothetical protein
MPLQSTPPREPEPALRCPKCGAALQLDQVSRRRLALAAFEPRPGQRFDAEVSRLLDRIVAAAERKP